MSAENLLSSNVDLDYPNIRPSLDLNFGRTKTLDPSISFSRSSSGTYIDKNGYIRTAGVNQPRFDHDPITGECKGLLVEEQRTNLQTRSQDINTWNDIYLVTIDNNFDISPSGEKNADRITNIPNSSPTSYIQQKAQLSINTTHCFSFFVKKIFGNGILIVQFDNIFYNGQNPLTCNLNNLTISGTGSYTYKFEEYPNEWYRVSIVFTPNFSGFCGTFHFGGYGITQAISSVLLWGVQAEVGSFATSYIPTTTTSSVTRAADKPIINTSLGAFGTLYAEAETTTSSGLIFTADNGVNSFSMTLNNGNDSKYALTYTPNKYIQMSSDINSIPTEIKNVSVPTNLNKISLGYDTLNSSSYINGCIKRFTYYNSLLTENNVKTIVGNTNQIFR